MKHNKSLQQPARILPSLLTNVQNDEDKNDLESHLPSHYHSSEDSSRARNRLEEVDEDDDDDDEKDVCSKAMYDDDDDDDIQPPNDGIDTPTTTTSKNAMRKAAKKLKKQQRRAQREGRGDQTAGQKQCHMCGKSVDLLIRCTYDESLEWHMVCGKCWKVASGGVVDGDAAHPFYRYGGLWKNRRK